MYIISASVKTGDLMGSPPAESILIAISASIAMSYNDGDVSGRRLVET
jgi:hypothetical protein